MAGKRKYTRKTPKSKYSRKVNRRKQKPKKRVTLNKKQLAKFEFLMSGGTIPGDESE